jgi:phosphoglycolate phosphatase-like HAD superfamily hydrolase
MNEGDMDMDGRTMTARGLTWGRTATILLGLALLMPVMASPPDPLPSWNDTANKRAIMEFVSAVTTPTGRHFVAPAERIAVFDNDGTLWSEKPMYFQLAFAIERVRALAPGHPEWKDQEPFKSVLSGDMAGVAATGEHGLIELVMASHAGNTSEEFQREVRDWIATARHPKTGKRYDQMVFQPMLELLAYLRANGFKTYIVSGGGIEFMRAFAERVYGVPPEQVIGSSIDTKYEVRDGVPAIVRLPQLEFIDDKDGKPVGIHKFIGRRPIAAFGNSDGDFQMLEWTTSGPGPRLGALVRHTDATREYAYDRESSIGRLDRGLDEAPRRGWLLIDMKRDWNRVYP